MLRLRTLLLTFILLPILILPLFLAGCGLLPSSTTPTPISTPAPIPIQLGVGYIPSVQFAPLYVAIQKGYFVQEGLDVSLEYGYETDFLKLTGLGERSFAIASGDQVILAGAQGLPVTYVAEWYTKYPIVIFAPTANHIQTPQDLVGRRVGIPGLFGASYVGWKALVYAEHLPEDRIQLESIGFTQVAALQEGLVDAAVDYAANGPVQFQIQGIPTRVIVVDDYMHLPSNGLVTNHDTITQHPQRVAGMVRAMLRGIAFTLAHPDQAFEISLGFVPEAAQNRDVNRAIFDASLPYWTPASPDALGRTDPAIWPATASFMKDVGLIDHVPATDDLWTNTFVDQAHQTGIPSELD